MEQSWVECKLQVRLFFSLLSSLCFFSFSLFAFLSLISLLSSLIYTRQNFQPEAMAKLSSTVVMLAGAPSGVTITMVCIDSTFGSPSGNMVYLSLINNDLFIYSFIYCLLLLICRGVSSSGKSGEVINILESMHVKNFKHYIMNGKKE